MEATNQSILDDAVNTLLAGNEPIAEETEAEEVEVDEAEEADEESDESEEYEEEDEPSWRVNPIFESVDDHSEKIAAGNNPDQAIAFIHHRKT